MPIQGIAMKKAAKKIAIAKKHEAIVGKIATKKVRIASDSHLPC
jgi:hypothetical protein